MKKKEMKIKNDSLLQSYKDFTLANNKLSQVSGGESTSGYTHDPDGCTAKWRDSTDTGFMSHAEDHETCD